MYCPSRLGRLRFIRKIAGVNTCEIIGRGHHVSIFSDLTILKSETDTTDVFLTFSFIELHRTLVIVAIVEGQITCDVLSGRHICKLLVVLVSSFRLDMLDALGMNLRMSFSFVELLR